MNKKRDDYSSILRQIVEYHESNLGIEGKVEYYMFSCHYTMLGNACMYRRSKYIVGLNRNISVLHFYQTIAHELRHIYQYDKGLLEYRKTEEVNFLDHKTTKQLCFWDGNIVPNNTNYKDRPQEVDARDYADAESMFSVKTRLHKNFNYLRSVGGYNEVFKAY